MCPCKGLITTKRMISKFDIQKLQDLSIESVADALGLEVRRHKALCPFHDDSHPSLTFSVSRNRYRCYVCGARGGTIDLVMNTQHWSFYDSCRWLADKFDVYIPEFSGGVQAVRKVRKVQKRSQSKPKATPSVDIHYLEGLLSRAGSLNDFSNRFSNDFEERSDDPNSLNPEAKKFLFEERRLNPKVVKWLGLSSISHPVPMSGNPSGSWFNAPSLLIPYRDIDGRLLSVQARYLGSDKDKPRFQFPKGSRCSIYNLPILRHLTPGEPLFVTEGCSDCWSILSAGHKAIAIPSATALNESDLKPLEKYVVHIYPDQDKAGEQLYERLLQASIHLGFTLVRHQLPPTCKDFSDYYLQALNSLH